MRRVKTAVRTLGLLRWNFGGALLAKLNFIVDQPIEIEIVEERIACLAVV